MKLHVEGLEFVNSIKQEQIMNLKGNMRVFCRVKPGINEGAITYP